MKIKMEDMEKKSQMEVLDMKNTILQFTISLGGLNIRVDTTEEKTRELEDMAMETVRNEAQREKWLRHHAQGLSDL